MLQLSRLASDLDHHVAIKFDPCHLWNPQFYNALSLESCFAQCEDKTEVRNKKRDAAVSISELALKSQGTSPRISRKVKHAFENSEIRKSIPQKRVQYAPTFQISIGS